jgi:hypothetical protein
MRTEIPREMNDPFSDLYLESLRVPRKLTLQAGPNRISDLIISRCRAKSHLIDHGLGCHRARHRENLPACRLCINLSAQNHDLGVIMDRHFVRSIFDLLLNRSTDQTGIRS